LLKLNFADPANTITIDDVRTIKKDDSSQLEMARQLPSSISVTCNFKDRNFLGNVFVIVKQNVHKQKIVILKAKKLCKEIQERIREFRPKDFGFTCFWYYGTGRLWKEKRLTESKKDSY
jgi:hypothetical protein